MSKNIKTSPNWKVKYVIIFLKYYIVKISRLINTHK